MFSLLIFPEQLPHLEVYEQAVDRQVETKTHSLHWGIIQVARSGLHGSAFSYAFL